LRTALLASLLLLVATVAAPAQFGGGTSSSGGSSSGSNGGYYNYSEAEGYTISVNLWGFVNAPGKYRVPSSTTLIQLISMAGGPNDRARLSDISILHDVTIDSTIVEPVNVFNLEEYQRTADSSLNPILIDNDTVIVPGDALNVFREILAVFRDIALVVGTVLGLVLAFKK
jgi:protein involved in polysaccharide export with SLBB domain